MKHVWFFPTYFNTYAPKFCRIAKISCKIPDMKFSTIILEAGTVLFLAGCTAVEPPRIPAPAFLPGVEPQMFSPGYWVSGHPSPDREIMTPGQIRVFNGGLRENPDFLRDIAEHPETIEGKQFTLSMTETLNDFAGKKLFLSNGSPANKTFYDTLEHNMALDAVPAQIKAGFAVVTERSSLRFFPENNGLYRDRVSRDFDRAQNSGVDIGAPLAILHSSADGRWYYAQCATCAGWVETRCVATCGRKEISAFANPGQFAVITAEKGQIFLNGNLTQYAASARMGNSFPLVAMTRNAAEIILPVRNADGSLAFSRGFVPAEEIHEGYLPFTAAVIMRQAFKLLNAPYDWGDKHGEQDCSRFIQEIFSTVGLTLPRNSSEQGKIGVPVPGFNAGASFEEKLAALRNAPGGITLLKMPGHIMLFLGADGNNAYAIHSFWGYSTRAGKKRKIAVVNRVAVSNLSLGENSPDGSFLQRVTSARILMP